MKSKNCLKLIGLPLMTFALTTAFVMGGTETTTTAAPTPAPESDWLKVSGYAGISYTYTDVENGPNNETFADGGTPLDAVKVGLEATQGPFGGYVSLFYTPGFDSHSSGTNEAGILDAYATYKTGDFTITGGKYLSWLGYEAFDTVNMSQLTYANVGVGAIPAYHSGAKVDYSTDTFGAGFNISDSIRGDDAFWDGDGEFSDSIGFEGYVVYKGIEKLTVWAGFGYEANDDPAFAGADWQTYDLWASYDVTDKLTVAAEVAYHDDRVTCGTQGLAFAKYSFTDKLSLVGRFGIDEVESGGDDNYKYTISPTYAFTDYFLVRAEVSYSDSIDDSLFSGVQALLKF